jgi:diguanylate cyclase (GGDEF)-like protein
MTKDDVSDAVVAKREITAEAMIDETEPIRHKAQLFAATIFIAIVQIISLILLLVYFPTPNSIHWLVLLFFTLLTIALAVYANLVSQKNVQQIKELIHQIAERETQLSQQTIRDSLTNLYSRSYLEQTLERELQRSLRDHSAVGIILADIDRFKNFNHTYGHAVGDMMLKKLGEYLQEGVRVSDIACRYGGEEFAIIITEASRELTLERAEHLRKEISQIKLDYEGQSIQGITISIGVAIYPEHGLTVDALLKNADLALFQAKVEGRNQVVLYQKAME